MTISTEVSGNLTSTGSLLSLLDIAKKLEIYNVSSWNISRASRGNVPHQVTAREGSRACWGPSLQLPSVLFLGLHWPNPVSLNVLFHTSPYITTGVDTELLGTPEGKPRWAKTLTHLRSAQEEALTRGLNAKRRCREGQNRYICDDRRVSASPENNLAGSTDISWRTSK